MSKDCFNTEEFSFGYYEKNRFLCEVLDDLRKCYDNRNYSQMSSLLDEAETLTIKMIEGLKKDEKSI